MVDKNFSNSFSRGFGYRYTLRSFHRPRLNTINAIIHPTTGDNTQLEATKPSFPQFTQLTPHCIKPKPTNAPIIECVVEMGISFHVASVTHIAAALGLPCLVLWPETNEAIWGPQGERVVILKEPRGLRTLDVNWVFEELALLLA